MTGAQREIELAAAASRWFETTVANAAAAKYSGDALGDELLAAFRPMIELAFVAGAAMALEAAEAVPA